MLCSEFYSFQHVQVRLHAPGSRVAILAGILLLLVSRRCPQSTMAFNALDRAFAGYSGPAPLEPHRCIWDDSPRVASSSLLLDSCRAASLVMPVWHGVSCYSTSPPPPLW